MSCNLKNRVFAAANKRIEEPNNSVHLQCSASWQLALHLYGLIPKNSVFVALSQKAARL
jgi:hypothetical protein